MPVQCAWCDGVLGTGRLTPDARASFGICPTCYATLEDELAEAAARLGRPARSDAETAPLLSDRSLHPPDDARTRPGAAPEDTPRGTRPE